MTFDPFSSDYDWQWLAVKEESLLFDEVLVHRKFNDLDDVNKEEEPDKHAPKEEKKKAESQANEHDHAYNAAGLVHVDQNDFNKKAIQQWTKELTVACSLPTDVSTSFDNALKKRFMVQKFLHSIYLAEKTRRKRVKKPGASPPDAVHRGVPVVVRLGVLTMFPLIESLSTIKDVNYQKLCSRTLDIVISVVNSLPPLALHDEPADCLDAFKDFILKLIDDYGHIVDTVQKAQAVVALTGVAISRGGPRNLLEVVDCLFKIFDKQSLTNEQPFAISRFLEQLSDHQKDSEAPILHERTWLESWTIESSSPVSKDNKAKSLVPVEMNTAIASDTSYIWLHNKDRGLVRLGTGYYNTVRGHIYKSKETYRVADASSSLALVRGKLYFFSSELTMEDSSPADKNKAQPTATGSTDISAGSNASVGSTSAPDTTQEKQLSVIAILDSKSLQEERRVKLKTSILAQEFQEARLTSNGRYLYVIFRKKEKKSKNASDRSTREISLPVSIQLTDEIPNLGDFGAEERALLEEQLRGMGHQIPDPLLPDDSNRDDDSSSSSSASENAGEGEGWGSDDDRDIEARVYERANRIVPPSDLSQEAQTAVQLAIDSGSGKYIVEVYDPLKITKDSDEISPDRSFEIHGPEIGASSDKLKQFDIALMATEFTKGTFYTNGHHLVCMYPSSIPRKVGSAYTLNKARVWSMVDGKFLGEHSTKAIPGPTSATYDFYDNILWTYTHEQRKISMWLNVGIKPYHAFPSDSKGESVTDSSQLSYPEFTPEYFLTKPEYALRPKDSAATIAKGPDMRTFSSLETIIFLLANMDRLARQHPLYDQCPVVDDTMTSSSNAIRHFYSVADDPKVFEYLYSIMNRALAHIEAGTKHQTSMVYVLHACLRLLRVNLNDVLISSTPFETSFTNAGYPSEGAELMSKIRDLLLGFVTSPPNIVGTERVRLEAIRTLTMGFVAFYRQPSQQIEFVMSVLRTAKENPGKAAFLARLLDELAEWYRVSDILSEDKPLTINKPEVTTESEKESREVEDREKKRRKSTKEKLTKESKEDPPQTPVNKFAKQLLVVLIEHVIDEAKAQIVKFNTTKEIETAPYLSPAIRLLLSIQRDILSLVFGRSLLQDYAIFAIQKCTELLVDINQNYKELFTMNKASSETYFDALLHSSVVGVVLRAIILALCRRQHLRKQEFVVAIFPLLINLAKAIDAINKQLPTAKSADSRYLRRLNGKKDRQLTVESKHPYPYEKNQTQKVTIPGAHALSLHFDPRSRTSSSSSDVLKLFTGPSLDQPVTLNGNQIYFSGTNFPRTSLVVEGDTVAFVFNVTTRPDPHTKSSPARWGYRCTVTELASPNTYQPAISHWLLDLENAITWLSGKCTATLIEGEAPSELEVKYGEWLSSDLLHGGLERLDSGQPDSPTGARVSTSDAEDPAAKWLLDFVENEKSEAAQLYKWMKKQNKGQILPGLTGIHIDSAERYVIAAMIKHMCIVDDAIAFSKALVAPEVPPKDVMVHEAKFRILGRKSAQVATWVLRRGQMEKEWQVAVEEKKDITALDKYKSDHPRMRELCEMKGVEFDLMETDETVNKLFTKLKEDIELASRTEGGYHPTNAYELMARPVIEGAKFLLRLAPTFSELRSPAANAANPFSIGEAMTHMRGSAPGDFIDESTYLHPLSRSMEIPKSFEKKLKSEADKQREKDFSRRVGQLRKWIQAYHSWQKWQEDALPIRGLKEHEAPPASPLQAIVSFVQSSLPLADIEKFIRTQVSRAKSRVLGLKNLCLLLDLCTFGSVRHQILGSIGRPLISGGHFLNDIPTCGHELSVNVENEFSFLFEKIVQILGQTTFDPTSRLLALGICSLSYRDTDVHLLQTTRIFHLLCQIFSREKDSNVSPITALSAPPAKAQVGEDVSMEVVEADTTDKTTSPEKESVRISQEDRATREEEERERDNKRRLILCSSAWTSFRLLATQCSSWTLGGGPRAAILQLQGQVFDLMCAELQRLSQHVKPHVVGERTEAENEDGEQCYQLLSLLYLLGDSSHRLKALSNPDNISCLISLLGTNTAPRSQRLVLRLCRRLFPLQNEDKVEEHVNLLMEELGKWLFSPKFGGQPDGRLNLRTSTQADKPLIDAEVSGSESDDEETGLKPGLCGVVIHSWPLGEKRLIDMCHTTLGLEFFVESLAALGANPAANAAALRPVFSNIEAKVQALMQEMHTSGSALLKTGTADQCQRLAQALGAQGAVITVSEITEADKQPKKERQNPNDQQKQKWPVFWANGHIASSISSEFVTLLRFLLGLHTSDAGSQWSDTIQNLLVTRLCEIPELVKSLESGDISSTKTNYNRVLAALSVIGGFEESVRVGGKVRIRARHSSTPCQGTVVAYSEKTANQVDVIIDGEDSANSNISVDYAALTPIPEICVDPSIIKDLAPVIVPALLSVVHKENKSASEEARFLVSDLKSRALSALVSLLSNAEFAKVVLSPNCSDKLPMLITMAKQCDQIDNPDDLALARVQFAQALWDSNTNPMNERATSKSPMIAVLPYFPYNTKADLLPTCFERSKQPGVVYWGNDYRTVEYMGFAGHSSHSSRGRPSLFQNFTRNRQAQNTEVLIHGNVPVPVIDYYFEITIEKADSQAIISLGLGPEGANSWGTGSYRYQANRIKTWYARGSRRQENYGTYFSTGHTIGCGFDQENKTVYFTKDGEELGTAFGNVWMGERVVPVIGIGRGVRVRINFGQEKFKYQIVESSTLDEAEREQKRKEADKRRKKELADEEERIRQEKARDRQRKLDMAEQITIMGYSVKQALKALEMTGFGGPEAAVNWLLENPDYNFDDEAEAADAQVEEEKKKEEEDEEEETEEQPASEPDLFMDVTVSPENTYNKANTALYHLHNCFMFDATSQKPGVATGPSISSEWEDLLLPELRAFMERDSSGNFSQLEISDFLQQIRNQLGQGNEEKAMAMYHKILGDQAAHIRLPSRNREGQEAASNVLKIDQVHIGNTLVVKDWRAEAFGASPAVDKEIEKVWIREMDATIGRSGIVTSVDHKSQHVLIKFYHPEFATLEEWWYPVTSLSKEKEPTATQSTTQPTRSEDIEDTFVEPVVTKPVIKLPHEGELPDLEKGIISLRTKLSSIFARRVILLLLRHTELNLHEGPLNVLDLLQISSDEYLSSVSALATSRPLLGTEELSHHSERANITGGMNFLEQKLVKLQGSLVASAPPEPSKPPTEPTSAATETTPSVPESTEPVQSTKDQQAPAKPVEPPAPPTPSSQLIDLLLLECRKAFAISQKVVAQSTTIQCDPAKLGVPNHVLVQNPYAHLLMVVFDRSCSIPADSGATLNFFLDAACTKLVKSVTDKDSLNTVVIPGNSFYHQLTAKPQQTTVRFKFTVVPATYAFARLRWIVEYITRYGLDARPNLEPIFNGILDFIYSCKTPTILKEAMFGLLWQLINRLRNRPDGETFLATFPYKRMSKLRDEMLSLHETESNRDGLFSSYLQSLIDLIAVFKLEQLQCHTVNPALSQQHAQELEGDCAEPSNTEVQPPAAPPAASDDASDDDEISAFSLFSSTPSGPPPAPPGPGLKYAPPAYMSTIAAVLNASTGSSVPPATAPGNKQTAPAPSQPQQTQDVNATTASISSLAQAMFQASETPTTQDGSLDDEDDEELRAALALSMQMEGGDGTGDIDPALLVLLGKDTAKPTAEKPKEKDDAVKVEPEPAAVSNEDEAKDVKEKAEQAQAPKETQTKELEPTKPDDKDVKPVDDKPKDTPEQKPDAVDPTPARESQHEEKPQVPKKEDETEGEKVKGKENEKEKEKEQEKEKPQTDSQSKEVNSDEKDSDDDSDSDSGSDEEISKKEKKADAKAPQEPAKEKDASSGSVPPPPPPPPSEPAPSPGVFAAALQQALGLSTKPKKKREDPQWFSNYVSVLQGFEYLEVRSKAAAGAAIKAAAVPPVPPQKPPPVPPPATAITTATTDAGTTATTTGTLSSDVPPKQTQSSTDSSAQPPTTPVTPATTETTSTPTESAAEGSESTAANTTTSSATTTTATTSTTTTTTATTTTTTTTTSTTTTTTATTATTTATTTTPSTAPGSATEGTTTSPTDAPATTTTATPTTTPPAPAQPPAPVEPPYTYAEKIVADIVRSAWLHTKNDRIKERIILIANLPVVTAAKRPEFVQFLQDFLDTLSTVVKGSIFLPLDAEKNNTKSWCFAEFWSTEEISNIVSKLSRQKLKLPPHFAARREAPATQGAKKDKLLHVKKFESLSAYDPRIVEFLRSFLYSDTTHSITPNCQTLLKEVFIKFAGSEDGVLGPDDLDRLQMVTNGEEFGAENIEFALNSFDVKTIKKQVVTKKVQSDESKLKSDKEDTDDKKVEPSTAKEPELEEVDVKGLTLGGFYALYSDQCDHEPIETWTEFFNLGYDLHMNLSSFLTFQEAVKACSSGNEQLDYATDHQLLRYIEAMISDAIPELHNPITMIPAHVMPIKSTGHQAHLATIYPLLAELDICTIRLRFEILRQFNIKLATSLPLFNIDGSNAIGRRACHYRSLIFHSTKMEFFYHVLDKTAVEGNQPTVSYNRLKLAARNEKRDPSQKMTDEHVQKDTAFGIAYTQLRPIDPAVFRQRKPPGAEPHFSVLIQFKGEHVEGEGGPYRQFFTDVSKELQHSGIPLLVPCPNAQQKQGENRDKFLVSPAAKSRTQLRMYRFLGQLMGMSVRTGVLLSLDLPTFVWKPLAGEPVVRSDLEMVDQAFDGTLKWLEECQPQDVDPGSPNRVIFTKFSIPLSDKSVALLKKNGDQIEVTHANRHEYVQLAEKKRLEESKMQLEAIRRGLSDVVPVHLLSLLTWQDLEWRVCGKPKIDFKLLRRHTEYSGVSPNAPHITYFWQVLESLPPDERRAFVRFAWGQERLPANDQEFERTSTRMLIKPFMGTTDPDQAFPKADTCFFNLMLPEYTSPEVLKEKLLFAITTDDRSMNADNPPSDTDRSSFNYIQL